MEGGLAQASTPNQGAAAVPHAAIGMPSTGAHQQPQQLAGSTSLLQSHAYPSPQQQQQHFIARGGSGAMSSPTAMALTPIFKGVHENNENASRNGDFLKAVAAGAPLGIAAPKTRQNLVHLLTPKLMVVINAVVESERDIFEMHTAAAISPTDEESIRRAIFEDRQWIDTLCRAPHLAPRVQRPIVWGTPSIKPIEFPSPAIGKMVPQKRSNASGGGSLHASLEPAHMSSTNTSPIPDMGHAHAADIGGSVDDFTQSSAMLVKDLVLLLQDLGIATTNNNDMQAHAFRHRLISLLNNNFGPNYLRNFIVQHNLPPAPLYPCTEGANGQDDEDDEEDDDDDDDHSSAGDAHNESSKRVKRSHNAASGEPCLQLFSTFSLLQKHMMTAHSSNHRPFVCSYDGCTRSFSTMERLTNHQQDHSV